jgi:hypothetical protein
VQATNSTRASHITVVSPELRAWLQNAFEEQEGRAKGR